MTTDQKKRLKIMLIVAAIVAAATLLLLQRYVHEIESGGDIVGPFPMASASR